MPDITNLLELRPDRLQLQTFQELTHHVPAPWLIRDVLRQQSLTLLYGRRGCYKSFLALDLAASLATGLSWQTHETTSNGLVVYIAGEGGGGMVQRARAWANDHDVTPTRINMQFVVEPAIITAESDDMDILIHRIQEAIGWIAAGDSVPDYGFIEYECAREWPQLIVIDTLARCFIGNENQQEDMGRFIQGVDRLKQAFHTSVLILHHTGRDESHERGSTVLGGACDTIYKLEADVGRKRLTLTNEKMKDSREPAPLVLSYREVDVPKRPYDDPNEDWTSIVIGPSTVQQRQARLLSLLKDNPMTHSHWHSVSKTPISTFNRLIASLAENGQIIKQNGQWHAK